MLIKAIEKNRLAHAYLFEGSRGTGKKRVALQLVKSFFCQQRHHAEACQICGDCRRIEHGNHPDVHMIYPDGQSIKKHQIDYLQKEFTYRGVESAKKVYVIHDADLMTASAANSLLKFLEEPASPTLAILLTTQGQKILPTIKSRSQHLTFSPLSRQLFSARLEQHGHSKIISSILASLTTSEEEAQRLLEGEWIAQARNVVIQLMEEYISRPNQAIFTIQEKWLPLFKERWQQSVGLDMILLWMKDLLYLKVGKEDSLTYIDKKEQLEQQVLSMTQDHLNKQIRAVFEAKKQLVANVNPQLLMESLLLTI